MPDSKSLIETKVKAFAKDLTTKLTAARTKKIAELKKADKKAKPAEIEAKVTKVTFAYSSGKGSLSRTPQQQAQYISDGKSWTCAGAHVVDKARHVKMLLTEPGKKQTVSWATNKAFGSKDHHFMTWNDFKKIWKDLMKTHDVKNYKGQDGYGDGDGFHLELADSKVPKSDKRVQACLLHYATLTVKDGKPKNNSFENGSWKSALAPHLKKVQAEVDKAEAEKRKEELKKMSFDGKITASGALVKKLNKNKKAQVALPGVIDPPSPIDSGGAKFKKIKATGVAEWQNLKSDLFEFLGIEPSSGYDVKVIFNLDYTLVTYDHLSQSFIKDIKLTYVAGFDTLAAKAMGLDMSYAAKVSLGKSDKAPTGTVTVDFELKTPLDKDRGKAVFTITGANASGKVTWN